MKIEDVQYIQANPQMKAGRVKQLDKQCLGVHVTRDRIFTTCCHNYGGDGEVRFLDSNGNLQRRLLGVEQDGTYMFTWPNYITVSPAEDKMFVSDSFNGTITCMAMDNHIIYQYKDDEMMCPRGLYCDDGNNILVCSEDSNYVQVITAEGKNLVSSYQ